MTLKRKILIGTLVVLLLLVSNTIFNAVRIDMGSFGNSAIRLLKKSKILIKRAETFDQKKALMKMGMNKINEFYYRFDDHIDEAICENERIGRVKAQKDLGSFSFEFNSNETIKFKPKKGKFILEDDLLKFKYTRGSYLQNIEELNIIKDDIGEIELRIKLKKGKRIKLGWSNNSSAEWADNKEVGRITIYAVPDDTFRIYSINAKDVLRRRLEFGDRIKKVFLHLSNINGDEVEIDYIRFISKRKKYAKEPYGQTYETIDKEMRKVLYTNTPLYLKYKLDIPEGKVFLRFGIGVLKENDPVRFRVVVKHGDSQKEIFSKKVINSDEWYDVRMDFSDWSGKSVEILLETESEQGNIAFWSNSIIYTPPRKRFNIIIVLEDSLRADHMSCYGYFRETTPVKDKFVKKGVLFLNAFSQATKTRPSCPSIMTSLYPTATGVWNFSEMLNDKYLTLAEIMRNQGFETASFIQTSNAGPCAGLHQGFSNLFDAASLGKRAEQIYGRKLYEWIEANIDRNLFLYLHLQDPHWPYEPPKPFDSWNGEGSLEKRFVERHRWFVPERAENPNLEARRLVYDREIRYNDFCFGGFLKKLKEYKWLNDTLIILIADHGEHLGEHGLGGHNPPGYIQVLHVPLLMVYPKKLPEDVKIVQPVQLIDIMPTILDLTNIDKGNLLIEGDSLLPLIYGQRQNFWNNRLCLSEEVVSKSKDDKSEWASIFYKNWHIINSDRLNDGLSKLMQRLNQKIYEIFFATRVFNYFKDKKEKYYLNSFLFDMFFGYKVKCFVRRLQENNRKIWEALTEGTDETIKYDPEEIEQLKALGYLQ